LFNAHLHLQLFTSQVKSSKYSPHSKEPNPQQAEHFSFNMTPHLKLQVEEEDRVESEFLYFKLHSKKPRIVIHHLAVLIGHDSAEL
jgi:hypothetical protein